MSRSPLNILEKVLLPRVNQHGMARIFVAQSHWQHRMNLPAGMSAEHSPLQGKRVSRRNKYAYGKASVIDAHWPADNLQSARVPKLFFCLSFPIEMQIADYKVRYHPGDGIFVRPGIPFPVRPAPVYELLQILPYRGGLTCWNTRRWKDNSGEEYVEGQSISIPHSQASFYFLQLAEEVSEKSPQSQIICDSLLKLALAILLRELRDAPVLQVENPHEVHETFSKKGQSHSATVLEYIQQNMKHPLSIDKVARYACMSRTIFTAWFRDKTGKTFNRYLQDLRFDAACDLLRGGDLNIQHIATAVGFKPNRMRVIFRERLGISPSEYRQKHR